MWVIHPVLCENVTIQNVNVTSHGPNNDGCNPESSKNVLIRDCYFDTGDDCIAIKSGRNEDGRRVNIACENIVVQDCVMKDGHGGIVIGSEISGNCRNVFAENCTMDSPNLERALRIKTNSLRGGIIENVYLRNIQVGQVSEAVIKVNFYYGEGDMGRYLPVVRNIHLENVHSTKSKYALLIKGYSRSAVRDIYLQNCFFKNASESNILLNVENLALTNVHINGKTYNYIVNNIFSDQIQKTIEDLLVDGYIKDIDEKIVRSVKVYEIRGVKSGNNLKLLIKEDGTLLDKKGI